MITGSASSLAINECADNSPPARHCTTYNTTFTMYAETDLDQPTDYSLRYAEDSELNCNKIKNEPVEFVQDTVKTYCTEDTPYETPFNFSPSTSMSDLRIDEKTDTKPTKDPVITAKEQPQVKIKSEFSSGLMSPEKPVNYCDEGTPGYFSRVASCGSLNLIETPPKTEVKTTVRKAKNEAKAVKFEEVVSYVQETPLMFSRSSSLASLDSIEQHSIQDDRSSVVSDFSRLTSGIISPSELPDSPSQTVPPSPRPRKTMNLFPPLPKKKIEGIPEIVPDTSKTVFEDDVKKFKVENTPLNFSLATSLSSLIDEEAEDKNVGNTKSCRIPEIKCELTNELSESSEDEDILNACINIGVKNNKYNQTADVTCDSLRTYCTEGTPAVLSHAGSNSDLSLLSMHLNQTGLSKDTFKEEKEELLQMTQLEDTKDDDIVEITAAFASKVEIKNDSRRSSFSSLSDDSHESEVALLEECILAGMPKSNTPTIAGIDEKNIEQFSEDEDEEKLLENCITVGMQSNRYTKSPNLQPDTVKNYCTEDTPAFLSNAGSCSNLSNLSAQGNDVYDVKDDFSDLNSNYSDDEDEEKLLEDCVKFGMAAMAEKMQNGNTSKLTDDNSNYRPSSPSSVSSSDSSSSYESEHALLAQCMAAGMPKAKHEKSSKRNSNDLTPAEKLLLQQCILEGMKKCQKPVEESGELTEAEHALLRQCILSGMPRSNGRRGFRESAELTESERTLLQQCIMAGMPKTKRERRRKGDSHTCCVHCPKNKGKARRKRDVSIVYVTSQVVVKKEVVGRGKWV